MKLFFADKILSDKDFREKIKEIERLEKDRIFCRHGIDHFLDTARITLILCQEKKIKVNEDVIYCASLLHDTGRAEEYKNGVQHHLASVEFAKKILEKIGADENFKKQVLSLVECHRKTNPENTIEYIFSLADKKSRQCFMCEAVDKCKWNDEKKNLTLEV